MVHSLRDDMVDCHPEETLLTEAEPRSTMLSEGLRSTMSSREECNIYFIMPNVPISFTTSIMCDYLLLKKFVHRANFYWNVTIRCTPG